MWANAFSAATAVWATHRWVPIVTAIRTATNATVAVDRRGTAMGLLPSPRAEGRLSPA